MWVWYAQTLRVLKHSAFVCTQEPFAGTGLRICGNTKVMCGNYTIISTKVQTVGVLRNTCVEALHPYT